MARIFLTSFTYNVVYTAFIVWSVLLTFSDASCKFPEQFKTNGTDRDWRGRIKDQNTEVTLHISITDNIIRVVSTDNSATSYSRVCVSTVGNKYLVAHEEEGQIGLRFTCVQFVQRTDNVFQFREAPVGTSMEKRKVCNNNNLNLNPWLIMDINHVANDVRTFPFSGGYSVLIFDKKHSKGVCDSYQGQTRIESECVAGEGLYFHYRYRRCIPEDIYMYEEQRTLCLGCWQEGTYTFALLRHDDRERYMWILRYPTGLGDSITMILFNDLVADTDPHASATRNYLRLDAVRDTPVPAHALCADDYEACSVRNNPCDDGAMAMVCPRTCGLCHATRPRICTFENNYHGQWYNAAEPGSLALTVNHTSLTTYSNNDQEQMHCIEWDKEQSSDSHLKTRMLVREFDNGCKPRFSCVQFMQQSSSILFLKLSQRLAWPFTSTPREAIDCSNFVYDVEEDSLSPNKFRSKSFNLVYIRASNTVPCGLPRTEGSYVASFKDGDKCMASILQNQSANSFILNLVNCSDTYLASTYSCTDNTRMFSRKDQILITKSDSNRDLIYCWMLPRRQHDIFYLIKASDCNEALRKRLSRSRIKPLLTLSRSGTVPEVDYDVDRDANELPTVVVEHPVNRPYPTRSSYQNSPTPFRKLDDVVYIPELDSNSSHPHGNYTYGDSNMEITATTVAVVTVVIVMAALQTLCVCNC